MRGRTDWMRASALVLLVLLVTSAMLGFAGVLYEWVSGTHAGHAAGGGPVAGLALPVAVDFVGVVAAFFVVAQVMSGYGLFRVRPGGFRVVHLGLAWTTLGLAAAHGAGGVVHALQPPVESLTVLLCYVGVGIAALLAPQVLEGRRLSRIPKGNVRRLHIGLATAVSFVVLGHVVGGVVHSVIG